MTVVKMTCTVTGGDYQPWMCRTFVVTCLLLKCWLFRFGFGFVTTWLGLGKDLVWVKVSILFMKKLCYLTDFVALILHHPTPSLAPVVFTTATPTHNKLARPIYTVYPFVSSFDLSNTRVKHMQRFISPDLSPLCTVTASNHE